MATNNKKTNGNPRARKPEPAAELRAKLKDLQPDIDDAADAYLTTNQGLRINDNQNSLKSGDRGPTLLEDFILREKITHFDHERIPERVVHARGAAAHGFFQVYESQAALTKADFLQDPKVKTPVFVRFSTVAGSRGSTDLARDVRGFAVKFYTQEGNYDLVGNNMPVFFIQDAIKFPDLIHAVKPEPHNEIPQAASAHDTFWDFISLMPESMHMIMWAMSDRAIPRSLRMMQGFGVHTFRFINAEGAARFVKFHWSPMLGTHSVVWDEAQKISGKDADFHRRDLWEAIEKGNFPEWELGVQIVEEADERKFDFDLLDSTKLIPEELVPVVPIGKMTLNRNPDNFFAETEQVAYHLGNLVPGIDFTNDPLLQGRLFSYTDTQLLRLGGPNFHEIPINRSVAPVHNNQRDGFHRQTINRGHTSYDPNAIAGGCPFQAGQDMGGFVSHMERVSGAKVRARSESFFDHFSQATLFFNSQSAAGQNHIVKALQFELGKVETAAIRERMVAMLTQVDKKLAARVAKSLGLPAPTAPPEQMNHSVPADGDPARFQSKKLKKNIGSSPALSMEARPGDPLKTRKVAILVGDGFDGDAVAALTKALQAVGAQAKLVGTRLGPITSSAGKQMPASLSLLTTSSVLFDAVFVPGGADSIAALLQEDAAEEFIKDAYKHCKTIGGSGEGAQLLMQVLSKWPGVDGTPPDIPSSEGLVLSAKGARDLANQFVETLALGRHWSREPEY